MPKGPRGQKRPADVIGAAIMVAKIATGEFEDKSELEGKEYASKGGKIGGKNRAKTLSPRRRNEIARIAANARWKKKNDS